MNYLVFLKLGGISNGCGNDLPDERSSLLKTFGQLGAVMAAVRHRGPALLGTTATLVRIRRECSGAVSFRPGHLRVPANALLSRPERHTCLCSKARTLSPERSGLNRIMFEQCSRILREFEEHATFPSSLLKTQIALRHHRVPDKSCSKEAGSASLFHPPLPTSVTIEYFLTNVFQPPQSHGTPPSPSGETLSRLPALVLSGC